MPRVNIEDIERQLKERRKINRIPFDKIEWYKNGKKLCIPMSVAADFKFTGLNNTDFVACGVYKEKD